MPDYLDPEDYNASYFDGITQPTRHNAGYSLYKRWPRYDRIRGRSGSTGEYFKDLAEALMEELELDVGNKQVLIIGCAKGFLVKSLRDLTVDAWGIDVSSYAIGEAEPGMGDYLEIADARTKLADYNNNAWDYIISMRFMECVPDVDVDALITEMNRVSKNQYHIIGEFENANYYTQRSIADWILKDWAAGTVLESHATGAKETK